MKTQKYSVNQHLIDTLLAWVKGYDEFLKQRRVLMAEKMKTYYFQL